MDNKTIVKNYLKKYFGAQYLKETDQEFKALVRILNKVAKQAKGASSDNFEYKVKINATLPQEDAELVYKAMQKHPDIVKYTLRGQFGFSFINYHAGQDVTRAWAVQELDKMSKALEWPYFGDHITRQRLFKLLMGWVDQINQEYKRLAE